MCVQLQYNVKSRHLEIAEPAELAEPTEPAEPTETREIYEIHAWKIIRFFKVFLSINSLTHCQELIIIL
jgi:hypothetical protein